jgi:predicted SnoaL-like aldol condensation-catalyzing enzyme
MDLDRLCDRHVAWWFDGSAGEPRPTGHFNGGNMKKYNRTLLLAALSAAIAFSALPLHAQEAVMGVKDPEALFTSKDKTLNRNKQAAYHIMKELLECNFWQDADKYLTERYIQHNPNAKSGRQGVVDYFVKVVGRKPSASCPAKMATKVVSVVAEGDYVIVTTPREFKDPKDPSKTYTTSWFDQWRFVDGKADEHWDGAQKAQ